MYISNSNSVSFQLTHLFCHFFCFTLLVQKTLKLGTGHPLALTLKHQGLNKLKVDISEYQEKPRVS